MSQLTSLLLYAGAVAVPILLAAGYAEWKLRKRIDNKGDFIDEAFDEGPMDEVEQALEYKQKQLHETEDNILRLSPREIFAVLGMDYHLRLSIEEVEHRNRYPVVQIHIKERLKKFAPPPVGWYSTYARHTYEIEIPTLDEMLGEDVIYVDGDHGRLNAIGISSYEERTEQGVFDDEIRVTYERQWEEVEPPTTNRYGCRFTIEEKRERVVTDEDITWEQGRDKDIKF